MKQRLLILLSLIFTSYTANAQLANFPSFANLVETLSPSVVNISTNSKTKSDDKHSTLGSGFILDKEGYILTNSHVVDNAKDITVILHDNIPLSAIIIGTDKKTDIALIKVDTTHPLSPVRLGNSETIRVGDWILAIGNPFGLGGSVTAGIISAKSRDIASGPYDSYIQTDASINQGNSGGPMFNLQGEVIGINTALFSTTGTNMGIGFAIPINQAHFIIKQLKEHGKVNRSWIGLKIQPQTENISTSHRPSIIVSGVTENSPAAQAGIEAGDMILSYNKKNISTPQNFSQFISEASLDSMIELEIMRNNIIRKIQLKTQIQPEEKKLLITNNKTDNINFPLIGMQLKEPDIGSDVPNLLTGLYIEQLYANSDAATKGIQKGNILIKIDGKDVITLANARDYIQDAVFDNHRPIELTILDENSSIRTITINLIEEK